MFVEFVEVVYSLLELAVWYLFRCIIIAIVRFIIVSSESGRVMVIAYRGAFGWWREGLGGVRDKWSPESLRWR